MLILSEKPQLLEKQQPLAKYVVLSLLRVGFFSVATLVVKMHTYNINAECMREVFLDVFQIPSI